MIFRYEIQWKAVTFSRKQQEQAINENVYGRFAGLVRKEPDYTHLATFLTKEKAQAFLQERGWHRERDYGPWKNGTSDYDIEAAIHHHEERDPKKWVGARHTEELVEMKHALAELGGWKGRQWLHEHGYMIMSNPGCFEWANDDRQA